MANSRDNKHTHAVTYLVLLLEANQGPQIFGDNTRLTDALLFDQPSLFLFVILPQLEERFGVFQPPASSFGLLLDSVPDKITNMMSLG
jgi:hypothetical protein